MAVGLDKPGMLAPVKGVQLATIGSGIKATGALDMLLVYFDEGSAVAGVFTKNAYCAAPVSISREHLAQGRVRALLVNSGNANAGTGERGMSDALSLCKTCGSQLGIDASQILPFSTGVISEFLPVDKMTTAVGQLTNTLVDNHWHEAAAAIMTTDTIPKAVSKQIVIDDQPVTITGIAKGSGMIHPDMATLLSFVATDASVDQQALQNAHADIAKRTFNCITVDGDTSTNDSFICIASGVQKNNPLNLSHPQWSEFCDALESVARQLAHAIIRDGEGATRFIEIEVSDGECADSCRQVALTVAHSPLVKTAFFAGDPNLGRILAAIGRSKIDNLDMKKVSLKLGGLPVADFGEPSPQYDESKANKIMAESDIQVQISLGLGDCSATVWTTDLSYDYVKINAEYRS